MTISRTRTATAPSHRRPGAAGAERGRPLSLTDLEIPVRPLLTREDETRSGLRIMRVLRLLAELLPRDPVGYRRFLARMSEVAEGGALMFTWLSLKKQIEADRAKAVRAFERAESLADDEPGKAMKAYERGVKVLRTYPLDPETVYQWSRDVVASRQDRGALGRTERGRKLRRLLERLVERLERERENMVLPNFRLVLKEVFRYHPTGMRRSDLFQEGILGLHKAVFRFDASRAIRFSTYATYWIRQSIRKCLIDKSRMIRIPQAIQEELRKTDNAMKASEADRVRRLMSETILFSYGESEDSNDRFSFEVKDPSIPELGEVLHTGTVPQAVGDALSDLSSRERDVVQRRFGLAGERPQTLEEIGVHLNLSRERIRQIEQEALARMRKSQDLMEVYEDLDLARATSATTHN